MLKIVKFGFCEYKTYERVEFEANNGTEHFSP